MSTTDKNRNRLITLLKELFQLDQPELDFGLYKIMHAKSEQITKFLQSDLLKEIEAAFGDVDQQRAAEAKANYEAAIEQAKKFGAPNPEETPGVQEAKSIYENAKDSGNAENEIYDHLYRFFERYYDMHIPIATFTKMVMAKITVFLISPNHKPIMNLFI